MSSELAHARALLFSSADANPVLRPGLLQQVARFTPAQNPLLRQVSTTGRDNLGSATPAFFRSTDFPHDPDAILTLLETRSQQHSLLSIEIPGLLMDNGATQRSQRLAAVLLRCPQLQRLDVSGAAITTPGARLIGQALAACPRLEHLDVSRCQVRRAGYQHVARWLQAAASLRHVNLSDAGLQDDATLHFITDALALCTGLQHLDLSRNQLSTAAANLLPPALQNHLVLTHLDLSRNAFAIGSAVDVAAALDECRALQYLDLSNNYFDDQAAQLLAAPISMLQHLRHLGLRRNHFRELAASEFMWAMRQGMSLQYLDLSDNGINAHGFRVMTVNHIGRGLTYLDLENNHIHLENLPDDLPDTDLPEMQSLVDLNLANNRFGDAYIDRLINELPNCTVLTSLNLRDIRATDAAVAALPHALEQLPQLQRLQLTTNLFTAAMKQQIRTAWLRHHTNTRGLFLDP